MKCTGDKIGDKIKGDDEHSGSACYVRNESYVPTASYQTNEEIPIVRYLLQWHAEVKPVVHRQGSM